MIFGCSEIIGCSEALKIQDIEVFTLVEKFKLI